jgi:periplasmic protein TonB
MFDSVLEQNLPRRQIGRGASFSLGVHALLVVLVVYLSSRPHKELEKNLRAVTFMNAPPPPPPPPPPPAGGGQQKPKVEPKTIIKKPDTVVETAKKPAESDSPKPEKHEEPEPGGQVGGVVGGVQGGVVGGVVGGVLGGVLGGQLGSTTAIPFGPGMGDRPTPVKPIQITYSQEAKAARIEGKMLLKCVIGVDGSVTNCRVIKGLPMVTKEVLDAVSKAKFTPVIFQGKPQPVDLVIPISVVAG